MTECQVVQLFEQMNRLRKLFKMLSVAYYAKYYGIILCLKPFLF